MTKPSGPVKTVGPRGYLEGHDGFAAGFKRRSGPVACVIGDLELIRPLGKAGVRCAVVASAGKVSRYSRFTRAVVPCADAEFSDQAAEKLVEKLVERLVQFTRAQPEPPVLFYQEDEHLLFVSRSRERLAHHLRFVVAETALVEDLVDKARFHNLAERLQLPVPSTRLIDSTAGNTPPDIDLQFPVIIKPVMRGKSWSNLGHEAKGCTRCHPRTMARYLGLVEASSHAACGPGTDSRP